MLEDSKTSFRKAIGLSRTTLHLRPGLRTPALVQHRAQDAVDAEPGMPEADVVHARLIMH